jgi:hypothetical protein
MCWTKIRTGRYGAGMTIETPAPLVSVREALRQIPVGRTKLYDLFDRSELVPIKVGARAFVTQRSIDEFVERLAAEAGST